MVMSYKEGELERLHSELYDIMARLIETCDRLSIAYVIVGGTAIGAHYEGEILAWDDDIDIGMERADYERFIREAERELPSGYTLQTPLNEPNTPYYFTKVRKDNTAFIAEDEVGLDIHHGIYVDIFPLDRCPDSPVVERLHRGAVRVLCNSFVAKAGKLKGEGAAMLFYRAVASVLPKSLIYWMLSAVQGAFSSCDTERVNIVRMPRDHIRRERLHPPQVVKFGDLQVKAPTELMEYLEWHYTGITRYVPKERQINHAPEVLIFDTTQSESI